MKRKNNRPLIVENLERREVFASDVLSSSHNRALAADVNSDSKVNATDALLIINAMTRHNRGSVLSSVNTAAQNHYDVNNDGLTTAVDALNVINTIARAAIVPIVAPIVPIVAPIVPIVAPIVPIVAAALVDDPGKAPGVGSIFQATFNTAEKNNAANPALENLLTDADVKTLLDRASMASSSNDGIIAIVDRAGRILGVRVESDVATAFQGRAKELAFAIDGAVAKARTAAFFSSNEAPLTSRTIRYISQSTMTQREVESSPIGADPRYVGPGFVAPIGVGGHFPPQTAFTPQVDLFAIEHQSRDSKTHAGADGIKGNGDDFVLNSRFNADRDFVPAIADNFFNTWPESYGAASGIAPELQSRGIATLAGGVPLYKLTKNAAGGFDLKSGAPLSKSVNLVGGIGVFFPGIDGYATHEQNFVHASQRRGQAQSEASRQNYYKVLEAEFVALAAASGNDKLVNGRVENGNIIYNNDFSRNLSFVNDVLPPAERFVSLAGRIDLVGLTLEIYGPTPTRENKNPGIDQLLNLGRQLGRGTSSGVDMDVTTTPGQKYLNGQAVPERWLVAPHASSQPGGLTAADVERIITQGVTQANATRAAIRLDVDNNFRPGAKTRMVLSVADTNGDLLGVFRMPDATIFSIDVSIAKARNTAYYADPNDLQDVDRIDFNADGVFGPPSTSLRTSGDSLPLGTSLTNRTFRFLVEPRFPTGTELPRDAANGLVNDANRTLRQQKSEVAKIVGPESILQMPGINPLTGEDLDQNNPLPVSVYNNPNTTTILSFASFVPSRNFRDPGDASVVIDGTATAQPLANQNGIVFFPGSTSLHLNGNAQLLVGGFGVSGDGVDQDDVVTGAGQSGFAPPQSIRVDNYNVGKVRLPFQKYNRNPTGR